MKKGKQINNLAFANLLDKLYSDLFNGRLRLASAWILLSHLTQANSLHSRPQTILTVKYRHGQRPS